MKPIYLSKKYKKIFKAGKTIYYAYCFEDREGFVAKYKLSGRPFVGEFGMRSFPYRYPCSNFESTQSLLDANVGEMNRYNLHRVFTSEKKALSYLKMNGNYKISDGERDYW